MADAIDCGKRLAVLSIADSDKDLLRSFRPILEACLDQILVDFYRHVRSFPEMASLFRDDAMVAHAKAAQKAHWLRLFGGQFGDDYMRSVQEIGRTHSRIGLEPHWYIGGYAFVLGRLLTVAVETRRDGVFGTIDRTQLGKLISIIARAILLDIDLAVAVYLEAQRALAERQQHEREAKIVTELTAIVQAASRGDLDQRVPLADKTGFFLDLCQAMNNLVENAGTTLADVAAVQGAIAAGDLTRRITADYQGVFGRLKTDVNATADRLTEVVTQIQQSSGEIATAAAEVAAGSDDLSRRSEQQASSLQETAASLHQMADVVRQNAENAEDANRQAAGAVEVAATGGRIVIDAVTAMDRIEASSQKIEDIVGMINDIAFQTNLLALNAAVEAARAGEMGKGFAVVAQEVRNLAQRSAQASKEIRALIAESSNEVAAGANLVKSAGQSLSGIVGSIRKVAAIVGEIASASREQSGDIKAISSAVADIDETTQQNAALVEQSSAAAVSLEEQSHRLTEMMGFFRAA